MHLNKRIRTYLSNLAQDMAATTVTLLAMRPAFAKIVEKREKQLQAAVAALVTWTAEMLETREHGNLEKKVYTYACRSGKKGVPLLFFVDGLRVCKEMIIRELQYIVDQEEKTQYFECMNEVHRLFDALIVQAVAAYHEMSAESLVPPIHSSPPKEKSHQWSFLPEHELIRAVFQSKDVALLLVDTELSVIGANVTFSEMFGLPHDEILGKGIDKVLPSHPSKRFVQWVLERGKVGHYVTELNGMWMTVSTRMVYREGVLRGAMAVFVKLTEINVYEENRTKQEALASVGQLAAGMAHEIRNPLTSIKGFIQLLKEQDDQRERDSYYSVILMEIERIDGLLNDVLVLARYRDENVIAQPFLVIDEVLGVMRLLEPEANRRGIKLELQVAKGEWYVHGYSARIKQAILNIMKNAFEALSSKGKVVRVSVAATAHEVVITIEDDGPGLSEEIQQKLFVPFYTTKPEGTGLGLSTTQRIIVDHRGVIFADNSPQLGGARFEVRLPLAFSR